MTRATFDFSHPCHPSVYNPVNPGMEAQNAVYRMGLAASVQSAPITHVTAMHRASPHKTALAERVLLTTANSPKGQLQPSRVSLIRIIILDVTYSSSSNQRAQHEKVE